MSNILSENSRLFILARLGQRQPSALGAILVVHVVLVFMIVIQAVARRLLGSVDNPIAGILGFLSIYLGLWICLHFWSKRPFWLLGFENTCVLQGVLGGASAGGVMVIAVAGLAMIPGASIAYGELETMGLAAVGPGILTLLATTVQSSSEEALFRGWLLPVIGARYRPWIGVLVSSLVFAIAHTLNGPTPLGWLNLFLFGMFAGILALAEGGLWGASAWHTVWNWAEGGLFGLVVDRSVPHPGLLVSIRTTGPDFITGGAFGPEGGVAATAVLAIGVTIAVLRTRRLPSC